MDGQLFGFEFDLLVTETGLIVAGMAAVIGIWVERDPTKPPRYAIWLSVLIVLATGVGMFQTYDDDQDQKKVEADLARVLQTLDKIANESDVELPELNDLIKTELAAQARSNPGVVDNFAQRLADEGEDPAQVMGAYLPESEVQNIARKQKIQPKPIAKKEEPRDGSALAQNAEATAAGGAQPVAGKPKRRRPLTFGGGPARLRSDDDKPKLTAPKPEDKPAEKADEPAEKADKADEKADDKKEINLSFKGLKGAGGKDDKPTSGLKLPPGKGTAQPDAAKPPTPAGGLKLNKR